MQWPIFIAYTAIVWLVFVKLRLLRLTFAWAMLFAAAGPVIFFFVLMAMNFYHPGSSDVQVLHRVVQVAPRISKPGRVSEVVVEANEPLKKGELLFRVDPKPFQFEVSRLEAALAASEQSVPELQSALDAAKASRARAQAQLELAQMTYQRQTDLLKQKVVAQATVDNAQRDLDAARQSEAAAAAGEEGARLQLESTIGGVNTSVAQVRQQLASAQDDLAETEVKAPCDGFVSNVNILPGQIVSGAAAVMPFVCDQEPEDRGKVVATFAQSAFLGVRAGDAAEVIFSMYPGQVFPAKVLYAVDITSGGQIGVGGVIPTITGQTAPPRFAAVLKLDDPNIHIPAGAHGSGAVYSERVPFAAMFRKGLVRTDTIVNYLAWGT
jgi:multidrug resistance efflux pump